MLVNTIEIFRTTIHSKREATKILKKLHLLFPNAKATIDLTDCDRVLRIAGEGFVVDEVVRVVRDAGFDCEILE